MDSYYETHKLYKNYLPEVLSFDEFKSVKTADGTMSFHICDGITGQTIDIVEELKQTYFIYQEILYSLKTSNYKLLKSVLSNPNNNISSYMKTSVKTLLEFLPYIKNTFTTKYHNGYIEGNNNFIKVIKRIAFGFRSFRRFKARIMICKGLIKMKKIANA